MKKGKWQKHFGDYVDLISAYDPSDFFLKPALDMGFDEETWSCIQSYHDETTIGVGHLANKSVERLEHMFDIKLAELYVKSV